jgi:hypothetical protein
MGSTIETYNQKMRKFFDLLIENEHLNIGVIKSVQENARREEQQCTIASFEMGYYKRDNTLILSARDKAGKSNRKRLK